MCANMCTHAGIYVCPHQRSTFRIQFSPSIRWVSGIKIRLPDLAASTFTQWALLSAQGMN